MRARTLVVVVAIAVIAAAIGRWTAPGVERAVAKVTDSESAHSDAAGPRGENPKPDPGASASTKSTDTLAVASANAADAAPTESKLGFDPEVFLAELPQRLDALAQRALNGEPRALAELADWIDYCSMAQRVANGTRIVDAALASALSDPALVAFFRHTTTSCTGWLSHYPWLLKERDEANAALERYRRGPRENWTEPLSLAARLRQRANDAGDLLARTHNSAGSEVATTCSARTPGTSPEEQLRFNQCAYEAARTQLQAILTNRDPQALAVVPNVVASYSPQLLSGSEFLRSYGGPEAEVRWTLAACQFGLDCGPTNRAVRMACTMGLCGYTHYRVYAADQLLVPSSMRRVDSQVSQLVGLILAANVDAILGPPPGG